MSGEREGSEPETTGGPAQATTAPGGKGGRRETDGTRPHPGGRPLGC